MNARGWFGLAVAVALCEAAGLLGSVFTAGSLSSWYAGLAKPAATPPGWLFGPVWTALYALMGVAAWLAYRAGDTNRRTRRTALALFGVQLLLNTLWSVLFFGLQDPALALADIVLLWLAIVATIASFARLSRTAAWLLVPYLLWVTFATHLNWSVVALN
jgi:tryptophan-rich sensory protein